jgi:hypothetical protein
MNKCFVHGQRKLEIVNSFNASAKDFVFGDKTKKFPKDSKILILIEYFNKTTD